MNYENKKESIRQFESRWGYDCEYMYRLLELSPEAFEKFENFMPMSYHQGSVPLEVYWVAKLTASREADCGPCLELGVKMALEAGVSGELVNAVARGESLQGELELVRQYANAVASASGIDEELLRFMKSRYGDVVISELGVAIAAARVYPTIKRAMGLAQSCSLMASVD